ncbi:hypothetical protein GKZ28_13135 [Clostridium chromiireducens]|uniref:Uncharacterized protein n=1 Tax=Clostridium chromiireducens TaxID=225345 RepID=A0A964RN09_9CLOT|nr:hypothetical protein [Clostridium chromiireducens]MVX64637.1 hypothetical protein [Clostridium chromiireducens]
MLQVEKTLKEIEQILNTHEEWEMEWFDYKLYLIDKDNDFEVSIIVDVLDSDETVLHKIKVERIGIGAENILTDIIHELYDSNINWMNKYIRGTKAFNSRKIKSISSWDSKGNKDKVDVLVQDLIERHKTTNKMKSDVSLYKSIVSDMYKVLNEIRGVE